LPFTDAAAAGAARVDERSSVLTVRLGAVAANYRHCQRLVGPAEWDSDDAKRLIRAVMK
jgi:hypothetical protein